jgi:hypothetical protein
VWHYAKYNETLQCHKKTLIEFHSNRTAAKTTTCKSKIREFTHAPFLQVFGIFRDATYLIELISIVVGVKMESWLGEWNISTSVNTTEVEKRA